MIQRTPGLSTLLAINLVLSATAFAQQTRYISDELRVPLRETPCGTCTIIHRGLVAGTKLTLQETDGEWSRVETAGGLAGWLPSQYLVENPIARIRLNAAEANTRALEEENGSLADQVEALQNKLTEAETQLAQVEHQRQQIVSELAAIKKTSENAMTLQEQNETLIKENRMLQSEVDVLTATKDQLVNDSSQKWFIYGGLTVFLGAILAVLIPQLKPRKRFSEWG